MPHHIATVGDQFTSSKVGGGLLAERICPLYMNEDDGI